MEETKEYKEYKLEREEKLKSVKSGKNVFHLSYFSGLISTSDLANYEKSINSIGSEFSSYDKNGDFNASLDSFTLDVCLIFSQITVQSIINNSINSATWDTMKYLLLQILKKTKNQVINKCSSKEITEKKISFGMKVSLDENTHFDFNLDGELSENIILESLDKTLDFIKIQKANSAYKHPYFVTYNKGEWKSLDVEKEMKKIALKQIRKKK